MVLGVLYDVWHFTIPYQILQEVKKMKTGSFFIDGKQTQAKTTTACQDCESCIEIGTANDNPVIVETINHKGLVVSQTELRNFIANAKAGRFDNFITTLEKGA